MGQLQWTARTDDGTFYQSLLAIEFNDYFTLDVHCSVSNCRNNSNSARVTANEKRVFRVVFGKIGTSKQDIAQR
jgi:hypothetical protein